MAPKQKRNRRRNINVRKTTANPPVQESVLPVQNINAVQVKSTQQTRTSTAEAISPRVNVLTELSRIGIVTGVIIIILVLLYVFIK